jgi:hypothetical protein
MFIGFLFVFSLADSLNLMYSGDLWIIFRTTFELTKNWVYSLIDKVFGTDLSDGLPQIQIRIKKPGSVAKVKDISDPFSFKEDDGMLSTTNKFYSVAEEGYMSDSSWDDPSHKWRVLYYAAAIVGVTIAGYLIYSNWDVIGSFFGGGTSGAASGSTGTNTTPSGGHSSQTSSIGNTTSEIGSRAGGTIQSSISSQSREPLASRLFRPFRGTADSTNFTPIDGVYNGIKSSPNVESSAVAGPSNTLNIAPPAALTGIQKEAYDKLVEETNKGLSNRASDKLAEFIRSSSPSPADEGVTVPVKKVTFSLSEEATKNNWEGHVSPHSSNSSNSSSGSTPIGSPVVEVTEIRAESPIASSSNIIATPTAKIPSLAQSSKLLDPDYIRSVSEAPLDRSVSPAEEIGGRGLKRAISPSTSSKGR